MFRCSMFRRKSRTGHHLNDVPPGIRLGPPASRLQLGPHPRLPPLPRSDIVLPGWESHITPSPGAFRAPAEGVMFTGDEKRCRERSHSLAG